MKNGDRARPDLLVWPFTRASAKNPIHVTFTPQETGLDTASTALIDHTRFIDRSRLQGMAIGRLAPVALKRLDRQLSWRVLPSLRPKTESIRSE